MPENLEANQHHASGGNDTGPRKHYRLPELLAPAGRMDVVEAVLDAGADAVYVSGKAFNMRRHRKDFHFDDAELRDVAERVHGSGRRLYVTVNSLVTERELAALLEYLAALADTGVDALIVQDFAVPKLCRDHRIRIPLHASTMMNVNSSEQGRFLKHAGFTRAVTSRDITLEAARRIGEEAGIEIEYFIHGDMCSVQSGQCLTSGIVFGKSSNRGQCMKPCRWAYDLVSLSTGHTGVEQKHLLAFRDLCLAQHVDDVVASGIASLKIEGRMRPAETLAPIVATYRRLLDALADNPLQGVRAPDDAAELHRSRTRNLTTGFTFRAPDDSAFDWGGDREPFFLSRRGSLPEWQTAPLQESEHTNTDKTPPPQLTVVAASCEAARAAAGAGASAIVWPWEGAWGPQLCTENLTSLHRLFRDLRDRDVRLVFTTPRILTEREMGQLDRFVACAEWADTFAVTGVAPLQSLVDRGKAVWLEAPLNLLNSEAARFLAPYGVERVLPSLESSLENIRHMCREAPELDVELPVYGPLVGMVLEHCLLAMTTQHISPRDVCKMPCSADRFALRDAGGTVRPVMTDRYCRNHILLERTLNMLPALPAIAAVAPTSVRVDARLHDADETAFLTDIFSRCLRDSDGSAGATAMVQERFPNIQYTFGAYPVGIGRDDSISRLALKKEEKDAAHRR